MKKKFIITLVAMLFSFSGVFAQEIGIRGVDLSDSAISIEELIAPADSIAVQADSLAEEELSFERIDSDMDITEYEERDSGGKNWIEDIGSNIPSFKSANKHWAGLGIHYSGLIDDLSNLSAPSDAKYMTVNAKSIGLTLNLFNLGIYSSQNFSIFSGLGFEINNFNFDRKNTIASNGTHIVNDDHFVASGVTVLRSKLVTSYMNIPLLVEYRFGQRHNAFINAGAIAGLYLGGHTKVKTMEDNSREIYKQTNKLHLRNFHYGFVVNAGYKKVGLSVNYFPHSIFRIGEGPSVQQINVGLSFYK